MNKIAIGSLKHKQKQTRSEVATLTSFSAQGRIFPEIFVGKGLYLSEKLSGIAAAHYLRLQLKGQSSTENTLR